MGSDNGFLTGAKSASSSLTIQALVVGLLIKGVAAIGYTIDPAAATTAAVWGTTLVLAVPDLIAWWGRVRATKRIG